MFNFGLVGLGGNPNWFQDYFVNQVIQDPSRLKQLPPELQQLVKNSPKYKQFLEQQTIKKTSLDLLAGKGGPGDLLGLATSQKMGQALRSVQAAAGAAGLAGSGLAGGALADIDTKLLANLAQSIAANQLQRISLGANILQGQQSLGLKKKELQQKEDQGFLGLIGALGSELIKVLF